MRKALKLSPLEELKDYENELWGRDPTVTPVNRGRSCERRDEDSDYEPGPKKPKKLKKPKARRYVNEPGDLTPASAKMKRRSEVNPSTAAPDVPLLDVPPAVVVADVAAPAAAQVLEEQEGEESHVGLLGFFGTYLHLMNAQLDDDDDAVVLEGFSSD